MRVAFKVITGLAVALLLAGCKSELYSGLQERDANEIIATLVTNGISASRSGSKDGAYVVTVNESQIPDATRILSAKGLPRAKFEGFGKVFQARGIVATPLEERARFKHALDQELANSISQVSGVVSARVHVMLPEQSPFETKKERARASVFIYTAADADIRSEIGTIKSLLVNSVEGLAYEDVAVALFPASSEAASSIPKASGLPGGRWMLGISLAGAFGVLTAMAVRNRSRKTVGVALPREKA